MFKFCTHFQMSSLCIQRNELSSKLSLSHLAFTGISYSLALTKVISLPHINSETHCVDNFLTPLLNLPSYLFTLLGIIKHTEPYLSFWTPWVPSLSCANIWKHYISLFFKAICYNTNTNLENVCSHACWDPTYDPDECCITAILHSIWFLSTSSCHILF